MKWIKSNVGWFTSMLAAFVILVGWLSGAFGYVVATEAKPAIKEEIRIHTLEVEPRFQALEMKQEAIVEQNEEALTILRKLDPDND
jgi:hypothetical protein